MLSEPVTDAQIISAERSLFRARMDIQQRTRSLALATSSAAREAETTASQSILSRWTSSTPAASHLASLEVELKCLEGMEGQMVKDVALLRKRKELREMGRTMKGRVWLALGWALSIYCVWRVFIVRCVSPSTPLTGRAVLHQPHLWVFAETSPRSSRRRLASTGNASRD